MSYFDYEQSKQIAYEGYSFYAIIMAAMRQADSDNLAKLQHAFPQTWKEFAYRYNAPGGIHPMDGDAAKIFLQGINEDLNLEGND